jgi:hypothetical protein
MHFSDALVHLREKYAVRRRSWPAGQSLSIVEGVPCKFFSSLRPYTAAHDSVFQVVEFLYPKHIALFTPAGAEPWMPHSAELLTDDWEVAQ